MTGAFRAEVRDWLAADGVVRAGRAGRPRRSVDSTRSVADVADGAVLGTVCALAFEFGALACAAQLLGAGRALLEASVRHVRVRTQFGRPVGAFQAVKHKLADVAIGLEFARPLLAAAAAALGKRLTLLAGTSPRPRWPAPTPPTGRPGWRSRCTARSATPRSTTSAYGSPRSAPSSPPGAPSPSTAPASSRRCYGD